MPHGHINNSDGEEYIIQNIVFYLIPKLGHPPSQNDT